MSLEEVIPSKGHNRKWRVKLYELSHRGQWTDNGTGYVYLVEKPQASLVMKVNDHNDELYTFPINDNYSFNLQNKTILTWNRNDEDGLGEDDTAISFQEKKGINEIWKYICMCTGKSDYEDDLSNNIVDAILDVSKANLPFIAREIREDIDEEQIQALLFYIKSNNCDFISKLGKVFIEEEKELERKDGSISSATTISYDLSIDSNYCERYKRTLKESKSLLKNLSFIYAIFKNIIMLADEQLIETMLSDNLYLTTFGALEYDFESLQNKNTPLRHRNYFRNEAHFNNYLYISDNELLAKIHLNYRLTYLKNSALSGVVKESFSQKINSMLKKANEKIVTYFLTHKELLSLLMTKLTLSKGKTVDSPVVKEGLSFIIELMNCAKETSCNRLPLNSSLCELGLIDKIISLLNSNSDQFPHEACITGIRIIKEIALCSPLIFKDTVIEHKSPILPLICNQVFNQSDLSFKHDFAQMISALYENCSLYDPIEDKLKSCLLDLINLLPSKTVSSESKVIILEIISQSLSLPCAITQLNSWVNDNAIEEKVLSIKAMTRQKNVILHLIQFLNALVVNDYDVILSEATFDWIICLFKGNIKKGNALSSAIISLFDMIKKKKHSLIYYLFSVRDSFFYANQAYFKGLIEEYEGDCNDSNEESPFDNSPLDRNQCRFDVINDDQGFESDIDVFDFKSTFEKEDEEDTTFLRKKTAASALFEDIINNCSDFTK